MFKIKSKFISTVIIAVVCGLFAGVAGEIITRVYFLKDFSIPYLNNDINVADLNAVYPNLIIRDAKKVVVNQDIKVAETISSVQSSLVKVFQEISPAISGKNTKATSSLDYYKLAEPLLTGLIITSDGWAVAPLTADLKTVLLEKGYLAISNDRKIYKIDKILKTTDAPAGVIFFHLAGATNLPIKKIVSRAELSLGQSVLVLNNSNQSFLSSLASFTKMPAVLSSDRLNAQLELAVNLNEESRPAFVFNLAGDLLALVDINQVVTPAFAYNSYWQNLLLPNSVPSPYLGVNYLDLNLVQPLATSLNKGAWLYPAGNQPAVLKNSPAELAGLKSGDIITWVDNQEINAANDLADFISKYRPNDKITLTYWRAGEEREAEVTLGALPK